MSDVEVQLAQFLYEKITCPNRRPIIASEEAYEMYDRMNATGLMDTIEEEWLRMHASLRERREQTKAINEKYGKLKKAIYDTGLFSRKQHWTDR